MCKIYGTRVAEIYFKVCGIRLGLPFFYRQSQNIAVTRYLYNYFAEKTVADFLLLEILLFFNVVVTLSKVRLGHA